MTEAQKKNSRYSDKVYVSKENLMALDKCKKQLQDSLGVIGKTSRSEVANFQMAFRFGPFSDEEIETIRREKLSPKQRSKWLLKQVELAEQEGRAVDFEKLMAQIQKPKKRLKRSRKEKSPSPERQGVSEEKMRLES